MNEVPVQDAASYAAPPPRPARLAPAPSPIGRAILISLMVAVFDFLTFALAPTIGPIIFAVFIAASFASVRIYLSRGELSLKPLGAAALGAMPWIWLSLFVAFSFSVMLSEQGQETLKSMANKTPEFAAALARLKNPGELISQTAQLFLICIPSGALGGVLGARWQPRSGPSH